jgi:cytochrome b
LQLEHDSLATKDDGPYSTTLRRLHLAFILFVAVLALSGFAIYFRKPLGLQALKATLLNFHAIAAYAFLLILGVRVFFGLRGADADRFNHVFPRRRDLRRLVVAEKRDRSRFHFARRSPLARTIAAALYLVLASNAASGLVRAGTDLHFPPVGPFVDAYLSVEGAVAGEKERLEKERAREVRRMKLFVGKIHIYGAFVIVATALVHATGVLVTEWSAPRDPKARGRALLMLLGPRRARR